MLTHPLRFETERWLVETVRRLAAKGNIGMPEVAVYEGEPNAFATGAFKNSSLVAVSTGLLESMTKEEVEARRQQDPIPRYEKWLEQNGYLDEARRKQVWAEIGEEVEASVRFALESADPDPERLFEAVQCCRAEATDVVGEERFRDTHERVTVSRRRMLESFSRAHFHFGAEPSAGGEHRGADDGGKPRRNDGLPAHDDVDA